MKYKRRGGEGRPAFEMSVETFLLRAKMKAARARLHSPGTMNMGLNPKVRYILTTEDVEWLHHEISPEESDEE